MRLGCAWYPEHWNEQRWPEDLRLMREAGMNVVRVAEFAWSRMEPEEGKFDLDWVERAIEAAARQELDTVLGTPSAAPPAWLTRRYPETLAVRENGRRDGHGNRCHFSPTSPRYLELAARMAEEMARRFGRHARVIAWQIDNEYSSVSYDDEARAQFQTFLRERYGTLEALNRRWTTAYWSQTYFDWSEIPLPIMGGHHPGLRLEFRRFVTEVYRHYQKVQLDAVRRHSDRPITHNYMGWFDVFDHYRVSEELDFASWDSYVGSGHLDPLKNGAIHDLTRGFKQRSFWLMETQPGHVNWSGINNDLDRGEVRAKAWHAVGHGADAVLYWQWRSALGGQEQYHGTLVGPDGTPRPLYQEVCELGRDFSRAAEALRDTTPVSDAALLHSYEDRWAISLQRHHKDFDPVAHLESFYRPLRRLSPSLDLVSPSAPLDGYRLVVAPHLHLMNADLTARLQHFVREGGHLVLGPRSGMKDRDNALLPSHQPGPLRELVGARVEEYYALDTEAPLSPSGRARIWAEWLEPDRDDVEVPLRYGRVNGWLDGRAAVVSRSVGRGRVCYVGAWLDPDSMATLARGWAQASGIDTAQASLPEGVELCRRVGPRGEVWIVVNHTVQPQRGRLPRAGRDVLSDGPASDAVELPPRGVAVVVASVG